MNIIWIKLTATCVLETTTEEEVPGSIRSQALFFRDHLIYWYRYMYEDEFDGDDDPFQNLSDSGTDSENEMNLAWL